jgi:hypothetical protein
MVLPGELAIEDCAAGDWLYHYNILRPIHFLPDRRWHSLAMRLRSLVGRAPPGPCWDRIWPRWSYDRDPQWAQLAAAAHLQKQAFVLVAPREVLTSRAAERSDVEPSRRGGERYDRERWLQFLTTVDLAHLYRCWCAELSARHIEWRFIDSSTDEYPEIPPDRLGDILGQVPEPVRTP